MKVSKGSLVVPSYGKSLEILVILQKQGALVLIPLRTKNSSRHENFVGHCQPKSNRSASLSKPQVVLSEPQKPVNHSIRRIWLNVLNCYFSWKEHRRHSIKNGYLWKGRQHRNRGRATPTRATVPSNMLNLISVSPGTEWHSLNSLLFIFPQRGQHNTKAFLILWKVKHETQLEMQGEPTKCKQTLSNLLHYDDIVKP